MNSLVYFSSKSENTNRFVKKLEMKALRISLETKKILKADVPYILILPSYGGGSIQGAIPTQVINFLNNSLNRSLLRGIIGAGNRNFGAAFCIAGKVVAKKCMVPFLCSFELSGTEDDVIQIRKGVKLFWKRQNLI